MQKEVRGENIKDEEVKVFSSMLSLYLYTKVNLDQSFIKLTVENKDGHL